MIRYKLSTPHGDVHVSLDSEQPNKVAPLVYDGSGAAVLAVKRWIYFQHGTYGQQIADWTAPKDLKAVLSKADAARFSPQLVLEEMGLKKLAVGGGEG